MARSFVFSTLIYICSFVSGAKISPSPAKFLIVSAPQSGQISYAMVQPGGRIGNVADEADKVMKVLVHGLSQPQGLAVDQPRQRLLVADPGAQAVYSFALWSHGDQLFTGSKTVIAEGSEARWVAADVAGNVFFSDEPRNQILKITSAQALRGDSVPQVVYDGASVNQVSLPGGVAADSFHTYWVNKQLDRDATVGSVIRGEEDVEANSTHDVVALSRNSPKSYGLCIAMDNVFYTQPASAIFAVKKVGGDPVTITDRLKNPRGCAWDGDGTVYVADRGANAVYSFAGNMQDLTAAKMSKTIDYEDAFGVAVFSGAQPGSRGAGFMGSCLVLAAAALVQVLL